MGAKVPIRRSMRRNKDRGATIVEASLIMPIMILVMVGTLELGLAFKDYLNISFASREAARVGALAGNDADADCDIVHSVVDSLSGTGNLDELTTLQIFKADPASGAATLTNTWTYVGTDPYDCANDWTKTIFWDPTTRKTTFGTSSQLDIIGVRLGVTHNWVTGLPPFNGSFTVDESTITRMEPEAFA